MKTRMVPHALTLGVAIGLVASVPMTLPLAFEQPAAVASVAVLAVVAGVGSAGRLVRRFNLERRVLRRFIAINTRRR